jgi:hypothetical protein
VLLLLLLLLLLLGACGPALIIDGNRLLQAAGLTLMWQPLAASSRGSRRLSVNGAPQLRQLHVAMVSA